MTVVDAVFEEAGPERRFSDILDAEPDSRAWIQEFMLEIEDWILDNVDNTGSLF